MGCDIHIYREQKREYYIGKTQWACIDHWKANPYYDSEGEDDEPRFMHEPFYRGRNYELFATLAGVRNRHDNEPISQPRGLPTNVSIHVKAESDSWGSDGHSHSWLTLHELKTFETRKSKVQHSGYMTQDNADLVDAGEMPREWCQGTNMPSYVYREWQFENYPLKDLIRLLDESVERNQKQISDHDLRIVFWFDN